VSEITLPQLLSIKVDISTVGHLIATGKLKSYLPQRTSYESVDVIYSSNGHQEKCLQSANTFSVINKFPNHCIAVQQLYANLILR